MPGIGVGEPHIMHARAHTLHSREHSLALGAGRKRSWAAVLIGKTEDILACLREAVSGGAEKRKGS